MGVGGGEFLPTVKRASELYGSVVKVNLYELCGDGAVIGVDGNCFLHRAAVPELTCVAGEGLEGDKHLSATSPRQVGHRPRPASSCTSNHSAPPIGTSAR